MCAGPIQVSTPHLYVSALPFAPKSSRIVKSHQQHFQQTLGFHNPSVIHWPQCQYSIHGHSNVVQSVAVSPDGKHIVSGSHDKTIRIWDTATGQAVGSPMEGHSDLVRSVAFSPDGKHIVSGSADQTIRIWDSATGQAVGSPLEGHIKEVLSVAFSSNGKHVVSLSADQVAHFHDMETEQPSPFNGKWAAPDTFAPNGKDIISLLYTQDVRNQSLEGLLGSAVLFQPSASGWLCGLEGQLLFWVPPKYCIGF